MDILFWVFNGQWVQGLFSCWRGKPQPINNINRLATIFFNYQQREQSINSFLNEVTIDFHQKWEMKDHVVLGFVDEVVSSFIAQPPLTQTWNEISRSSWGENLVELIHHNSLLGSVKIAYYPEKKKKRKKKVVSKTNWLKTNCPSKSNVPNMSLQFLQLGSS